MEINIGEGNRKEGHFFKMELIPARNNNHDK